MQAQAPPACRQPAWGQGRTYLGLVVQLEDAGGAGEEAAAPLHGPHHQALPPGGKGDGRHHLVHAGAIHDALVRDVPQVHLRPGQAGTALLQSSAFKAAGRLGLQEVQGFQSGVSTSDPDLQALEPDLGDRTFSVSQGQCPLILHHLAGQAWVSPGPCLELFRRGLHCRLLPLISQANLVGVWQCWSYAESPHA